MKKLLFALIPVTLLAGCVSWHKPGARPGEFEQAKYICLQESQQRVGVAQANAWGGTAVNTVQTNDMLFGNCMNAKGWSLQNTQAAQNQIQQQQASQSAFQSQLQSESSRISQQAKAVCENPDYKPYYSKSACQAQDITFEQLADQSKITSAQKAVLLKQRAAIAEIQKARAELNKRAGGKAAKIADAGNSYLIPQNDQNNLDLYNGKITWGEYNKNRKDIYTKFQERIKSIQ